MPTKQKQKQKLTKRISMKHKGGNNELFNELQKLIEMFLVVYKFRNGPVSIIQINDYIEANFDNLLKDISRNVNMLFIVTINHKFDNDIITKQIHKFIKQYNINVKLYDYGTINLYYMYNRLYPYTCIISKNNGNIKFYYILNSAYTNNIINFDLYNDDIGIQTYRHNMEIELKKTILKKPSKTSINSRRLPQNASRGIKKYQRI
jgi:hypothetical protein